MQRNRRRKSQAWARLRGLVIKQPPWLHVILYTEDEAVLGI
jgi:hypothetical protein